MKNRVVKYCFELSFLILSFSGFVKAQSQEEVIKTAYLEKFSSYITWPESHAFDDQLFNITVVGDKSFCLTVKKAFVNRKIKNLKVEVTCLDALRELPPTDLLFLQSEKIKDLEYAAELSRENTFLLVTDAEGFAQKGSHINFYITNKQTIHFEMNKKRLDQDKYKVEYLLFEFAKVITN